MKKNFDFTTTKDSTLPHPDKLSILHPLDVSGRSLESILVDTENALKKVLKKYWPREFNSQLNRDISDHLRHKKITWLNIQECWTHPETEEKRGELQKSFFYAKLHYLSAREHLINENRNASLISLIYAANLIGFLEGYEHLKTQTTARKSKATKGGKAKEENRKKIRELIPLLLEKSPKGGWRSEGKTIELIISSKELNDLLAEINSNYSKQTLYDLIADEITKPDNYNIYKKHRSS